MYKVFIDSLPVYFLKKETKIKKIFVVNTKVYEVNKNNLMCVLTEVSNFKLKPIEKIVLECSNVEEIWTLFVALYQFRVAAGGLVLNQNNQILMIFRNGFWDLPKGHVEINEEIEIGAIREVEEECGITKPIIKEKIVVTYHTYNYEGQKVLKENHWYKMTYNGNEKLKPQLEEGITKVEWKTLDEAKKCLFNSYSSIQDVFNVIQL